MKKVVVAILLLLPVFACGEKPKPNPADYTITVHVTACHLIDRCGVGGCMEVQHLDVVIDSKKYELEGYGPRPAYFWVLETGDYKARIAEDAKPKPGLGTASEYRRKYTLMFPDGTTRGYDVMGQEE